MNAVTANKPNDLPHRRGTPQGGIISPVLTNLALDGLQGARRSAFRRRKRAAGPNQMVNLVRDADDFVITGNSKELMEEKVRPLVEAFLAGRGLELSPEKTSITHIEGVLISWARRCANTLASCSSRPFSRA